MVTVTVSSFLSISVQSWDGLALLIVPVPSAPQVTLPPPCACTAASGAPSVIAIARAPYKAHHDLLPTVRILSPLREQLPAND